MFLPIKSSLWILELGYVRLPVNQVRIRPHEMGQGEKGGCEKKRRHWQLLLGQLQGKFPRVTKIFCESPGLDNQARSRCCCRAMFLHVALGCKSTAKQKRSIHSPKKGGRGRPIQVWFCWLVLSMRCN